MTIVAMPGRPSSAPAKQIAIHSSLPPARSVGRSSNSIRPSASQLAVPTTANGSIGGSSGTSLRGWALVTKPGYGRRAGGGEVGITGKIDVARRLLSYAN